MSTIPQETTLRGYLEYQADRVEALCAAHRTPVHVTGGVVGPRIVRFTLMPAPHIKYATIARMETDLAIALRVPSVQISSDVSGIVMEFPNPRPKEINFDDILPEVCPVATALLGLTTDGTPLLARLPSPDVAHILIAGTTGAGKSVLLRVIASSLALKNDPHVLAMLAIDPKNRTFPPDTTWAHLAHPVVTQENDMRQALFDLVALMEERDRTGEDMPHVIIFIDELNDLVISVEGAEQALTRLVQRGRESGIHIIAATQRPSAAVISGLMRANFPLRLVGRVVSADDARIASGRAGTNAHLLQGHGDFIAVGTDTTRFNVPMMSAESFEDYVTALSGQSMSLAQVVAGIDRRFPASLVPLPALPRDERDAKRLLEIAIDNGREWNSQREAESWLCGYNGGAATSRVQDAVRWIEGRFATTTTAIDVFSRVGGEYDAEQ